MVENQKELFSIANCVIKSGGWKKDQIPHKDTYKGPETYIKMNYEKAEEYIDQIEDLLDIKNKKSSLEERIEILAPYFKEVPET